MFVQPPDTSTPFSGSLHPRMGLLMRFAESVEEKKIEEPEEGHRCSGAGAGPHGRTRTSAIHMRIYSE